MPENYWKAFYLYIIGGDFTKLATSQKIDLDNYKLDCIN